MKIFKILLPLTLLVATGSAFTLKCAFNVTAGYHVLDEVYECLTTIAETPQNASITAVTGVHLANKTGADVEMLNIRGNNKLSLVPRGIPSFFPNLFAIIIHFGAIEVLHGDEFEEIPKLKWLAMNVGRLRTISGELFAQTPNVIYVNFGYNEIERVGADLFAPLDLSRVQRIGFLSNVCISRDGWQPWIADMVGYVREFCSPRECSNCDVFGRLCALESAVSDLQEGGWRNFGADGFYGKSNVVSGDEGAFSVGGRNDEVLELQRKVNALEKQVEWMANEMLKGSGKF